MSKTKATVDDRLRRLELEVSVLKAKVEKLSTPEVPLIGKATHWRPSKFYRGYEERKNEEGYLETRPISTVGLTPR